MKIPVYIQSYPPAIFWNLRGSILRTLRHPRKLSNLASYRIGLRKKGARVKNYPVLLTIEPSGGCNLKCPMCARSYRPTNKPGNMPVAPFKKMMDEIGSRLMFLLLFGYGEPLLNPNVFRFVEEAKRRDIITVMGTNACLLSREKADEMILSGLDLVVVALDAIEPETYHKYRVGGDFEKVVENIKYLTERKRALKKTTPIVDIQFLAFEENQNKFKEIGEFVSSLGADKYSLRKVVSYSQHDPDWSKVKKLLPEDDSEYVHSLYRKSSTGPQLKMFCSFPWRHATVNWDGNIVPCCKDIDSQHVLGNAFNGGSLDKTWNNREFQDFRSRLVEDIDSIEICRNCNRRANENPFFC